MTRGRLEEVEEGEMDMLNGDKVEGGNVKKEIKWKIEEVHMSEVDEFGEVNREKKREGIEAVYEDWKKQRNMKVNENTRE